MQTNKAEGKIMSLAPEKIVKVTRQTSCKWLPQGNYVVRYTHEQGDLMKPPQGNSKTNVDKCNQNRAYMKLTKPKIIKAGRHWNIKINKRNSIKRQTNKNLRE